MILSQKGTSVSDLNLISDEMFGKIQSSGDNEIITCLFFALNKQLVKSDNASLIFCRVSFASC